MGRAQQPSMRRKANPPSTKLPGLDRSALVTVSGGEGRIRVQQILPELLVRIDRHFDNSWRGL